VEKISSSGDANACPCVDTNEESEPHTPEGYGNFTFDENECAIQQTKTIQYHTRPPLMADALQWQSAYMRMK